MKFQGKNDFFLRNFIPEACHSNSLVFVIRSVSQHRSVSLLKHKADKYSIGHRNYDAIKI